MSISGQTPKNVQFSGVKNDDATAQEKHLR
jgi:hypothetical protein